MNRYIDAEKLKAEIEFWLNVYSGPNRVVCGGIEDAIFQDGRAAMCEDILTEIHSLQQEQTDVDLEKEYKEYVEDDPVFSKLTNRIVGIAIARHFYELGMSVMRERITNPDYNQKVVEKIKSEYPMDESNARKEE